MPEGVFWEKSCEESVKKAGFVAVEGWRSTFWHPSKKALLIIYVDDFKLASWGNTSEGIWADLKRTIALGEVTEPNRFLGCHAKEFAGQADYEG